MTKLFNSRFFAPIFVLAIGVAFLGFAALQLFDQYQLSKSGIETQGVVIGMEAHHSDDGSTYAPVVQFLTRNERQITFVSSMSAQPPDYKVGDTVTVIYSPDHPDKAEIKGAGTVLLIIFAVLGSVLIITGLITTFLVFRASPADNE